jgi:hypothetical protein
MCCHLPTVTPIVPMQQGSICDFQVAGLSAINRPPSPERRCARNTAAIECVIAENEFGIEGGFRNRMNHGARALKAGNVAGGNT